MYIHSLLMRCLLLYTLTFHIQIQLQSVHIPATKSELSRPCVHGTQLQLSIHTLLYFPNLHVNHVIQYGHADKALSGNLFLSQSCFKRSHVQYSAGVAVLLLEHEQGTPLVHVAAVYPATWMECFNLINWDGFPGSSYVKATILIDVAILHR